MDTKNMEPSEELKRFKDSLKLSYEQWHDGEGYDLEVLKRLKGSERVIAENILLDRKASDWRDIEALDVLGTETALEALNQALYSKRIEVRVEAAERMSRRGKIGTEEMENLIIQSLDEVTLLNGMSRVLRLVEQYPSRRICAKIRVLAIDGQKDIRVHAAAMYHFLSGGTEESFDWAHRPLYLRFGQSSKGDRMIALQELDALINQKAKPG